MSNVTLPNSATSIPRRTFSDCSGLTSITIPGSVKSIGIEAFYSCSGLTSVAFPDGLTTIEAEAFFDCTHLGSVTIPSSVTRIEGEAFAYCTNLTWVYSRGNAPSFGIQALEASPATVYYLPGTTGWGPDFGGRPTALWQPEMQTCDGSFGVRTNQFGFTLAWASGMVVVVDACTNLAIPLWSPLQTNTLTGDTLYLSDPGWTNHPQRFYRIRWP
ncbi:MAG: leucine-rich repeat domain-containing protein [Verrucomicrobia bacterium]|nr:leucine-rich repeat domain-containing protein [Verrucomicrobiota bacterium]